MTVTEVDARTLKLVRVFDAPRERVFAAWTDPGQFMMWMCPPECGLDRCELDARPGGAWRVTGFNEKRERFASSGKYLEVRRPERLVFTWAHHEMDDWSTPRGHETTVRVELRALGQRTELTVTHGPFADDRSRARHEEGWKGSFGKLDGFLHGGA